jgi:hypothetical protein
MPSPTTRTPERLTYVFLDTPGAEASALTSAELGYRTRDGRATAGRGYDATSDPTLTSMAGSPECRARIRETCPSCL